MSITNYKYNCKKCNYHTNTRQYFYAHSKTKKHNKKDHLEIKKDHKRDHLEIKKEHFCEHCNKKYKHKTNLYRHMKHSCKNKTKNITNINNGTINNITNTNNNTNNTIIFNVNSVEEANEIKKILTNKKINEICESNNIGLPLQSYDLVRNMQDFSFETKENSKLQNFQKTNARDNIINVFEDNIWKKKLYDEYHRNDLYKIAKIIYEECKKRNIEPCEEFEEKFSIIQDILKNYNSNKILNEEWGTIKYIIKAIDECNKESKLKNYNQTNKAIKL